MSRVITFSRFFPSYHPKAGQPTYFVEKIARSIFDDRVFSYKQIDKVASFGGYDITKLNLRPVEIFDPKHHTIRAGHRWKAGDWFSPRVWSGKPYNSKQIIIAPDIQVKKVWNFEIKELPSKNLYALQFYINGKLIGEDVREFVGKLATNDGLPEIDLIDWFTLPHEFKKKMGFTGQIICWNENINY